MRKKRKQEIKNMTSIERLIKTQRNEFHLKNCMNRSTMTKNAKKYNRKEKYKKDYTLDI